jgi:hypothetical protein
MEEDKAPFLDTEQHTSAVKMYRVRYSTVKGMKTEVSCRCGHTEISSSSSMKRSLAMETINSAKSSLTPVAPCSVG